MIADTDKADVVDTSHVDAALANASRSAANARRRAMLWTVAKSVFWGGLGIGALCFGASFLIQPKIIKVPELIEVPTVYETTRVIEKEVPAKVTEKEPAKATPFSPMPVPKPEPPPPPTVSSKGYDPCFSASTGSHCKVAEPPPAVPASESRPWNTLVGKCYRGIITDVSDDLVCFDHYNDRDHCMTVLRLRADGKAEVNVDGNPIQDTRYTLMPMRRWIGYSAYSASRPEDPAHLSDFWVADNGTLTKFVWVLKDQQANAEPHSSADSVALHTNDDGRSLFIDVDLGTSAYSFQLDTGASDMTVTETVAAGLIRDAHATSGSPETVTLADGSEHTVRSITINTVTVGTHRVSDVHATVSPDSAPMLLGMGVLNRIGRFTVDAPSRQLTFDGAAS